MYEREIYQLQRECDIDKWYEELKDITIKTYFLKLNKNQSSTLLDASKEYIEKNLSFKQILDEYNIKSFYKKVKIIIKEFPDGFFVRLNSRSPKDSEIIIRRGKNILNNLNKAKPGNLNEKIIWDLKARILGMRLKTVKDCLMVLFDSRRIRNDLKELISFGDEPTIVIREFLEIDPLTELRIFVKDRKIVAITQYNHLIVSKDLINNKKEYQNAVNSIYDKIREKIYLDDYIFDVGFLENEKNALNPILIEINPYCIGTSACLFNWRYDFQMGKNVPKEVEFRIRTQYLKEEEKNL